MAPGGGAKPPTTLEMLPNAGIVRVSRDGGGADGHCSPPIFFQLKRAAAPRVLGLPPLDFTPCLYRGQLGRLATVLGRPAYIEPETLDHTRMDSLLLISPWKGREWGRPCRVSIRYTYRYSATKEYCDSIPGLCMEARKIAVAVERSYHAWLATSIYDFNQSAGIAQPKFHYGGVMSARGRALVARARRLGLPKAVASASGARPAWRRHLNRHSIEYFPVRLRHKPYVGAVAHKAYPMPGLRFFLIQAPRTHSRHLVPLAVFTIS